MSTQETGFVRFEKIDKSLLKYLSVKVQKHDLETIYFEKKDKQIEKEKTK